MPDLIQVRGLEIYTHIGVSDEERARSQRLKITAEMKVDCIPSAALTDEVATTVDYADVCACIKDLAAERPRRLLETLAAEIASMILRRFQVREVRLEIKKFILPDTECVCISLNRKKLKTELG